MTKFRALHALRLTFVVWARNLVPFTLFMLAVYGPLVALLIALSGDEAALILLDPHDPVVPLVMAGIGVVAMPLLTYRVIQSVGGVRVPMRTSAKRGLRGWIPALLLAALSVGLLFLHFTGVVIGAVVLPFLFVMTPAAIAERRWPLATVQRSAQLTADPWLRIFALRALLAIGNGAIVGFTAPMWRDDLPGNELRLDVQAISVLTFAIAWQLFAQILESVTYVLLREAKEGLSNQPLVRVFE